MRKTMGKDRQERIDQLLNYMAVHCTDYICDRDENINSLKYPYKAFPTLLSILRHQLRELIHIQRMTSRSQKKSKNISEGNADIYISNIIPQNLIETLEFISINPEEEKAAQIIVSIESLHSNIEEFRLKVNNILILCEKHLVFFLDQENKCEIYNKLVRTHLGSDVALFIELIDEIYNKKMSESRNQLKLFLWNHSEFVYELNRHSSQIFQALKPKSIELPVIEERIHSKKKNYKADELCQVFLDDANVVLFLKLNEDAGWGAVLKNEAEKRQDFASYASSLKDVWEGIMPKDKRDQYVAVLKEQNKSKRQTDLVKLIKQEDIDFWYSDNRLLEFRRISGSYLGQQNYIDTVLQSIRTEMKSMLDMQFDHINEILRICESATPQSSPLRMTPTRETADIISQLICSQFVISSPKIDQNHSRLSPAKRSYEFVENQPENTRLDESLKRRREDALTKLAVSLETKVNKIERKQEVFKTRQLFMSTRQREDIQLLSEQVDNVDKQIKSFKPFGLNFHNLNYDALNDILDKIKKNSSLTPEQMGKIQEIERRIKRAQTLSRAENPFALFKNRSRCNSPARLEAPNGITSTPLVMN